MLADAMGWSVFETIGRLHCFWYWCLAYAATGDLRKFNDAQIGAAVVLNGDDAERFVKAMVAACWLDRGDGVFRVHDWLDYAGRYLRDTKFKRSTDKWAEAQQLYLKDICQPTVSRQSAVTTNQPTNRTNPPTAADMVSADKSVSDQVRARVGSMFKRPVSDHWNYSDESALFEVCRRPKALDELVELERFKTTPESFFPQSVSRLLSNWAETLDRARNATNQRSSRPGADRNAGTANEGRAADYGKPNSKVIR